MVSTCHRAICFTKSLSIDVDGIILGASKLNHLVANMNACEEGPLDERE